MTADYTTLIPSVNNKSTVGDKLSLKVDFNNSDSQSGMFDSLLSNASKSYADKTIESKNYFNSNEYANNTKDYTSSASKNTFNSSLKDAAQSKNIFNNNNNSINSKEPKTFDSAQENQCAQNTESVQNEQSSKIKDSSQENNINKNEDKNKIDDSVDNKNEKTENESSSNKTEKNESDLKQNEESSNSAKDDKENQTDKVQQQENTEEKTVSTAKQLAEVQLEPMQLLTPDSNIQSGTSQLQPQSQAVVNTQNVQVSTENNLPVAGDNTASDGDVSKLEAQKLNVNKTTESVIPDTLQQTKNTEIPDVVLQNVKDVPQNILQGNLAETVPAENELLQKVQTVQNRQNPELDTMPSSTNVDNNVPEVEIKSDIQKLNNETLKTESNTVRTAKDNLAADNTRYTINLENASNEAVEQNTIVTPTSKSETTTAQNQQPVIRVTDEVASQTKATENLPLNKDFSANAKDKAAAQMTEVQNTNTVVTDVQNNSARSNAQTNNGQNNSMTQGDASEQIIKFSVDDTSTTNVSTNPAESFMNKLDAKLGSALKGSQQNNILNKNDIMSQLNTKFNDMLQGGQNKVSMILQPENLGKVSVEIVNSKDGIVAKMTTENQQVKELLDKNMEALRSNLSSQGVNVNNIKVECTNESSNNAMNFEREQFNQSNFSNPNGQNHQTHREQYSQTVYTNTTYGSAEEYTEDTTENNVIDKNDSIIKHNGKVDYKV